MNRMAPLVKHHPEIGVITNIELDHPDRYKDIQEVIDIFQTFASQCKTSIGCVDDSHCARGITPHH